MRHLRKVEYSESRQPVTIGPRVGVHFFLTKGELWEYEQEWRMMLPLDGAAEVVTVGESKFHLFDYPRDSIRSITLGCRMGEAHKRMMIDTLQQTPALGKPVCLQAAPDADHFRMNTTQIEY
ncbi:hypothetical protein D3C84_815520 [compost metagenome]